MKAFTIAIAAAFLGACSGAPVEEGVFFPTWDADGAVPAGIVQGVLVKRDGCLFVGNGDQRTLVAWEDGMGFDGEALLDDTGAPIAQVGEMIHGGGGYFGSRTHLEELSGEPIPEQCLPPGRDVSEGDRYAIIYDVAAGPFE